MSPKLSERPTLECSPANAPKFREWIASRGGVAVWPSVNLSNLDTSWSTPALTPEGAPTPRPSWQSADAPSYVITSEADVRVTLRKEVKRFRVALRRAGLTVKVTDAGSRKIRAECEKAGADASYEFDYETQEAVITAPDTTIPLSEWRST
jgi:hypothetical protein